MITSSNLSLGLIGLNRFLGGSIELALMEISIDAFTDYEIPEYPYRPYEEP